MKLVSLLAFLITNSMFAYSQPKEERFFIIPRYFVANADAYIQGPFDADGSNTHICFKNDSSEYIEVKSMIEDRNKVLFKVPDFYGTSILYIVEEGTKSRISTKVNLIHLDTAFERIIYGQESNAKFQVLLLGANEIEDEYRFSFENRSPHLVNIIGGNSQKHKIKSTVTD